MRLSSFLAVEALVMQRNHLVSLRDEGRIEIAIGGHRLNREIVDSVEPAIKLELRHRIKEVDDRLQDLGVTIA